MQEVWSTIRRPNLQIMGIEGKEDIQTNAIHYLINNIIAENFHNLEKENIQVQEAEHQTVKTRKETTQDIS
jgi:hypothetical protein